jgi:hypothetical protein
VEKVICFNHEGNHYIKHGSLGYIIFGSGDSAVFITVRSRSGRFIERWAKLSDLYNFRLKSPESNFKATRYEEKDAESRVRDLEGRRLRKE